MTVQLELSAESVEVLRERSRALGMTLEAYASLEMDARMGVRADLWDQFERISDETHRAFLRSGMTDDELAEMLEDIKHESRGDLHYRDRHPRDRGK